MWVEYVGLCFLGFITFSLLGLTSTVLDIQKELKKINENIVQINSENYEHRKALVDSIDRLESESLLDLKQMAVNINDIKYVMDVIYKYKLPSKEDREFRDKNGL